MAGYDTTLPAPSRLCKADGSWDAVISNPCQRTPLARRLISFADTRGCCSPVLHSGLRFVHAVLCHLARVGAGRLLRHRRLHRRLHRNNRAHLHARCQVEHPVADLPADQVRCYFKRWKPGVVAADRRRQHGHRLVPPQLQGHADARLLPHGRMGRSFEPLRRYAQHWPPCLRSYLCLAEVTCPAVEEGSASWNETTFGQTVSGTCVSGFYGTVTRTCAAGGIWQPIVGTCERTALLMGISM